MTILEQAKKDFERLEGVVSNPALTEAQKEESVKTELRGLLKKFRAKPKPRAKPSEAWSKNVVKEALALEKKATAIKKSTGWTDGQFFTALDLYKPVYTQGGKPLQLADIGNKNPIAIIRRIVQAPQQWVTAETKLSPETIKTSEKDWPQAISKKTHQGLLLLFNRIYDRLNVIEEKITQYPHWKPPEPEKPKRPKGWVRPKSAPGK